MTHSWGWRRSFGYISFPRVFARKKYYELEWNLNSALRFSIPLHDLHTQAYRTWYPEAVNYLSIDKAQRPLTSVIVREPESQRYMALSMCVKQWLFIDLCERIYIHAVLCRHLCILDIFCPIPHFSRQLFFLFLAYPCLKHILFSFQYSWNSEQH